MQRVQTLMLLTVPLLIALIFWRLGRHILRVLLFAWLTLLPKLGPFPQIAHILDIWFNPPDLTEAIFFNRFHDSVQV